MGVMSVAVDVDVEVIHDVPTGMVAADWMAESNQVAEDSQPTSWVTWVRTEVHYGRTISMGRRIATHRVCIVVWGGGEEGRLTEGGVVGGRRARLSVAV